MPSRSARPPQDDPVAKDPPGLDREPADPGSEARSSAMPDLSALPIAGLGRRQLAIALGVVATAWIVLLFARQIGDASAASARAADLAAANDVLRDDIEAYRSELQLIQRQEYIVLEGRGYGLGKGREIPFSLAPDAPSLAPDAPGSAAVRVGAEAHGVTPFERWLDLLFGPG